MKNNEYKCAVCGNIYKRELTEEEAIEQLETEFGKTYKPDDCELVCDICYTKIFG
jgi:response regulator RpfG family c-di-GMP phosphodiesterase